jgi:hypothetical protein
MKRILFVAVMWCICGAAAAQNIGINATGATPAASAMLDITATDKGLLIPRVALTSTATAGPVTSPATSLLVYNTATAGTSPNNVTPGFYYWSGTAWVPLASASTLANKTWGLTGNAGTSAATNFVGTTDAVDLAVRTNNTEQLRVTSAGNLGVGTTTPQALLDVDGTVKLGTAGTALNGIIRTTATVSDNQTFTYTQTRAVTITVTGVRTNATIILNPRTALPTAIGVAWCRASANNTVIIGFTNADGTARAVGTVTFDVTIIQ